MHEVLASKLPSDALVKKLLTELLREKDGAMATGQRREQFVTDYYLIHITMNTGLRISEMANLTWGDVADEYLIVRNGKGGKTRSVYFGEKTKTLLDQYRAAQTLQKNSTADKAGLFMGERGQMTRIGLQKRFAYWKARMRLPKEFTFHSMRHYYATHMLESGVSLAMVKSQLGHASIATTSVYLHHTKSAREKLQAAS